MSQNVHRVGSQRQVWVESGHRVILAPFACAPPRHRGVYDETSPVAALEHLETYLRGVFGFIGITPEFVHADGIAVGPDERMAALEHALGEAVLLAA